MSSTTHTPRRLGQTTVKARPFVRMSERVWTGIAAALMIGIPLLRLEVARITLYDGLVLGLLGFMVFDNIMRLRGPRASLRWRPRVSWKFYGWYAAMIFFGLVSGLQALAFQNWAIELATFVYLMIMMLTFDAFSFSRLEKLLKVAVYVFGAIVLINGIGALLGITGLAHLPFLYPQSGRVVAEKFSGFTRAPNQWALYYVTFQPLLIALGLKEKRTWLQLFLLGAAFIGFITIPASGSRTGLVLGLVQALGIVGVMAFSAPSKERFRTFFGVLIAGVLGFVIFSLVIDSSDNWVVNRSLDGLSIFDSDSTGPTTGEWREKSFGWVFQEIEKNPIFGVGLGCFRLLYDRHEVHSTYLSLWAEGGPLVLLSFIGVLMTTLSKQLQAFLLSIRYKKDNALLLGLGVAMIGQLIFAISHNTTRTRSTMLLIWLGFAYAQYYIDALKAGTQRVKNAHAPPGLRRGRVSSR